MKPIWKITVILEENDVKRIDASRRGSDIKELKEVLESSIGKILNAEVSKDAL